MTITITDQALLDYLHANARGQLRSSRHGKPIPAVVPVEFELDQDLAELVENTREPGETDDSVLRRLIAASQAASGIERVN